MTMTLKKIHQNLTWAVELKTGKDHQQNQWHQPTPIFTSQGFLEW